MLHPLKTYKESACGCQCAPFRVEGRGNRKHRKRERKEEKEGEKRDSRVGPKEEKKEKHIERGEIFLFYIILKENA